MDYPQFSTATRLDRAEKNRSYSEKIRFKRTGQRTRASIAWHNLPSSLKVEVRNSRGYVKISGTPRDRDSHIVIGGNVSEESPPQVTEIFTLRDERQSRFADRENYAYRITAVYPDGETRAVVNPSVSVQTGDVVLATLNYDKRPFYFNVFRAKGSYRDPLFITRLEPQPSGAEYLLDTNAVIPRKMLATGNFYLMLKLTSKQGSSVDDGVVTTFQQFSLTIGEEENENERGHRYRCPVRLLL